MRIVELARGGTAAILEVNGERVVVLSSRASPPGSLLDATLDAETLRVKVRSCRQVDADAAGRSFRIEGRFVSLTRAQRDALSRE